MDLNHRPHPYQGCETIRTARNMNDQVSTVGAGQDVFTRDQCGPGEVVFEQRVAGRFLETSLSHPARSEGAAVQQRERPRRFVTANHPAPCPCQGRSLRSRYGAKRSSLDCDLEGPAFARPSRTVAGYSAGRGLMESLAKVMPCSILAGNPSISGRSRSSAMHSGEPPT